jgi:hypothetical protein
MIALLMIMLQVLGKYHVERPFSQQEHPLEGFLFDGPNEPFAVRVQIRTAWWQEERFYPTILEKRIKCPCEFRVSVVEEIAFTQEKPVKRIGQLAGTLLHEGAGRVGSDARNLHAPCGQFHDDKDIIRHEAVPGGDFDREEISGGEHLPMCLEELRPAHARLPSLRGRLHMVTAQDIPDGDRVDGMPQVGQGTLNPSITLRGIFLSHPDHELFDLLGDPRAPERSAMPAPVEFLGYERAVPA